MKIFLAIIMSFALISCKESPKNDIDFYDDFSYEKYAVENSYTKIALDKNWQFADFSKISTGTAHLYKADSRKNITIAINAGHGTKGGSAIKTYSHPDKTPKLTGGTTEAGAIYSTAVSSGMTFLCGLSEAEANLRVAVVLRKLLLENGYDVLMIRDDEDVQLDNIARTVISNNNATIHIAIHFDGDGKKYDKGVFYCGIPDGLKSLENVKKHYSESEHLGRCLINGLQEQGIKVFGTGRSEVDLTQTSYSTIPSIDIELGNQSTLPTTENIEKRANGIMTGIHEYLEHKGREY